MRWIVIVAALGLAACGGKSKGGDESTGSTSSGDTSGGSTSTGSSGGGTCAVSGQPCSGDVPCCHDGDWCNEVGECEYFMDSGDCGSTGCDSSTGGIACGELSTSMLSSVDDVVPGFDQTVAEIIGEVAGTYEGTFDWDANPFVSNTHAGTSSALTVPILYEGGSIEVQEPEFGDTVEGCPTILVVEVGMSFDTADGVFAEKNSATLTFDSQWGFASFDSDLHHFSFDTNLGTLAESDFMLDPGESLFGVSLLHDPPVSGSIVGSLFVEVDTGMGVSGNSVASWQVTKQ